MSDRPDVWVIDDDRSIRWVLERALEQAGMNVTTFSSGAGVIEALAQHQPAAVLSDIRMPGVDGLELMGQARDLYPKLPVIIMTAYADLDAAVSSYHGGAFEYLPKPFDVDDVVAVVRRACAQGGATEIPAEDVDAGRTPDLIGDSVAMQEVFRVIGRLARSNITVLINGESGTGKELVAHALHRHSPRAGKPFIALNMAAIPRDLLESELFGHERGAFTGAQTRRAGRFEQADGGTLFLDEIGDMPAELQTRLLRVLAEGEFFTVGGHAPVKVNVRIVAATHQDLEALVKQGRFREDLYHRLNVIRVRVPPLRERREDIPPLARHFLARAAVELEVEPKRLSEESMALLSTLDYPGNVRELENLCRRLTVMAAGQEINPDDLPVEVRGNGDTPLVAGDWQLALQRWAEQAFANGATALLDDALPRFEGILIDAALAATGGCKQDAAKLLGWGRNTLTRKLKVVATEDADPDRE